MLLFKKKTKSFGKNVWDPKEHPLHILIFSKDRACQLDSLLRSIRDNFIVPFKDITILHRWSNQEFCTGYKKLQESDHFTAIHWVEEQDFKRSLISTINEYSDNSMILFFVDDTIVFQKLTDTQIFSEFTDRHLYISFRYHHSPITDKWLNMKKLQSGYEWKWLRHKKKGVYRSYPFSVDGHVYKTNVMKKLVTQITFQAPNSFEGSLHRARKKIWIKKYSLALTTQSPHVFNNPLNRVQEENETWHKNISPDDLNRKYLDGFNIDNEVLYRAAPNDTHFYVKLQFKKDKPKGY